MLEKRKEEAFCRLLAQGESQTSAAAKAGYSASRAASQGCQLAKREHIRARVAELREVATIEAGKAIGISKDWVIQGLAQNIKDAREDKQYSVVKGCYELIGKELRMFVDRHEVTEVWDGDISKLTDAQLEQISRYFWGFVDPARREELQRQVLLTEGPVIEAEFVRVPANPVGKESLHTDPPGSNAVGSGTSDENAGISSPAENGEDW